MEAWDRASQGPMEVQRERQLALAKPLMQLAAQERLIVEVDEWINKSSGRGSLMVRRLSESYREDEALVKWPYFIAPGWDYEELIAAFFPWATLRPDPFFYEEYDREGWLLDNGIWDNEDGWFYDSQALSEYLNSLSDGIRPYDEDGEVAHYRLVADLNEIGEAFLTLDEYLRQPPHADVPVVVPDEDE